MNKLKPTVKTKLICGTVVIMPIAIIILIIAKLVEVLQLVAKAIGLHSTFGAGIAMEENDNGTVTLFVPSVPAITAGGLHIVEQNRVTLLDVSHLDVVKCITEWRMGSNRIVGREKMIDPGEM